MSQPRSRILIGLCLLVAATLVGGALGEKLPAAADRDTPSLDEYADILTTLSDWAPEPVSPDKIVYASRHDAVFDVIVMDSNGQNPVQITYDAGHNENPRWSADARKIYFSSSRLGKRQIFMMNPDGSDVVQLTQGEDTFNPAVGPRPRKQTTQPTSG